MWKNSSSRNFLHSIVTIRLVCVPYTLHRRTKLEGWEEKKQPGKTFVSSFETDVKFSVFEYSFENENVEWKWHRNRKKESFLLTMHLNKSKSFFVSLEDKRFVSDVFMGEKVLFLLVKFPRLRNWILSLKLCWCRKLAGRCWWWMERGLAGTVGRECEMFESSCENSFLRNLQSFWILIALGCLGM